MTRRPRHPRTKAARHQLPARPRPAPLEWTTGATPIGSLRDHVRGLADTVRHHRHRNPRMYQLGARGLLILLEDLFAGN